MGRRLGLVTIDPVFIDWHERQIRADALQGRLAGVRAIHIDLPGFMEAFTDEEAYQRVRADFVAQVRPLVAAGAEVIIPAGGLPMMLFSGEMDGAPVINGITVIAKSAEMAIKLRRLGAAKVSRRSNFARPPEKSLKEFLEHG